MDWYQLSASDALEKLNSSTGGLSGEEAAKIIVVE